MFSQVTDVTIVNIAIDLHLSQFLKQGEVDVIAFLQQRVSEHRHEGRCHAHGDFEVDRVLP